MLIQNILSVILDHVNHQDWLARKAAISSIIMLVKVTHDKTKFTPVKQDMLNVLNPVKADKYRPVREIASECLALVRTVPEMVSYRQ